jgi:hypothetical protein
MIGFVYLIFQVVGAWVVGKFIMNQIIFIFCPEYRKHICGDKE